MFIKTKLALLHKDYLLYLIGLGHLALVPCHFFNLTENPTHYNIWLRIGGCLLVSLLVLFFKRKGLSYGLFIYACILVYINSFHNYGSIFLVLIAICVNLKMKTAFLILYGINTAIAFSLQDLMVMSAVIHAIYLMLAFLCMNYVSSMTPKSSLVLTEDEKEILSELKKGKMQKEITTFSQQTITAKLKKARERNNCLSTSDLLGKFIRST